MLSVRRFFALFSVASIGALGACGGGSTQTAVDTGPDVRVVFPDTGAPDQRVVFLDTGAPDVGAPDQGTPDIPPVDISAPDVPTPDVPSPDVSADNITPDVPPVDTADSTDQGADLPLTDQGGPDTLGPPGPGWSCDGPIYVDSVPFSFQGDTNPTQNPGATNDFSKGPECVLNWSTSGSASEDMVFVFTPPVSAEFRFALTQGAQYMESILYIQSSCGGGVCLGADDKYEAGLGGGEEVFLSVTQGVPVFVIVDGYSDSGPVNGAFELTISAQESTCDDGQDNDGDQLIDCQDPDCAALPSCTEVDCSDQLDNDNDGETDCDDTDCFGVSSCTLPGNSCEDALPVTISDFPFSGDTSLFENFYNVTDCTGQSATGGTTTPEQVLAFTAQTSGVYTFTLSPSSGFDSVFYINKSCPMTPSGCSDPNQSGGTLVDDSISAPEELTLAIQNGETVYLFIDGWSGSGDDQGPYTLDVTLEGTEDDCTDEIDNDFDGFTDCDDTDCATLAGCFELNCADSVDDDNDGFTDCQDPDCDGQTGCVEDNCADSLDNDNDGSTDCDDLDCVSDGACVGQGLGDSCSNPIVVSISDFPVTNFDTSLFTNLTAANECEANASGGGSTAETVFALNIETSGLYTVTLDPQDSFFDSVLYLSTSCPLSTNACLGKADTVGTPETLTVQLNQGDTLYIYVDGWSSGDEGPFHLDLSVELTEDQCDDGQDNDFDTLIDCLDSDCLDSPSCFEADCEDGVSNDNDALIDCDDPDCWASEFCTPTNDSCETPYEITSFPVSGDTTNYTNLTSRGDCEPGASGGTSAPDAVYKYTATEPGAYTFIVDPVDESWGSNSWDAIVYVSSSCPLMGEDNCVGTADDPEEVTAVLYPGQSVYIFVDGYFSGGSGAFTIDVTIDPIETSCNDGVDNDSDFQTDCDDSDCINNDACKELICDDSLDEDNDGMTDCDDSDCAASTACFEFECGDSLDNDNDGMTDCMDPDCASSNTCLGVGDICSNALMYDLNSATLPIPGDTSTLTNQSARADCETNTSGGTSTAEQVIGWEPLAYGTYTFTVTPVGSNSFSFDPVMYISSACPLSTGACLGTEDSGGGGSSESITVTLEPFQPIWIYVDGWSSGDEGAFELDVLFEGMEDNCSDGMDNDADTLFDCDDPDCAGQDDCIETSCEDGLDEDGDGLFDCDDPDCALTSACAPAGDSCQNPIPLDSSGGYPIIVGGTTVGYADSSETCTSSWSTQDAPDVVYIFYPESAGTYRFSLAEDGMGELGSGAGTNFDSYLYLSEPSCPATTETCLECPSSTSWSNCNNDSAGDGGEILEVELSLGAGVMIYVDGYAGQSGNYELKVEQIVNQ